MTSNQSSPAIESFKLLTKTVSSNRKSKLKGGSSKKILDIEGEYLEEKFHFNIPLRLHYSPTAFLLSKWK